MFMRIILSVGTLAFLGILGLPTYTIVGMTPTPETELMQWSMIVFGICLYLGILHLIWRSE